MASRTYQSCLACGRAEAVAAALLVPGATMRGVAKAFGIPKSTLERHIKVHVTVVPEKPSTARSRAAPAIEAIAAASVGPTPREATQNALVALVAAPPPASAELEAPPPTACPICASPEQHAIGVAVRQGATYAAIVARHGVDFDVLRRHALGCIPDLLAQAGDLAARTSPGVVLGKSAGGMGDVERLVEQAQQLVSDACANTDPRKRAAAITAATGVLTLAAKMRGDIDADLGRRLVESEDWVKLRERILDALVAHPEALASVVATMGQGSA